ncbi:MAG TPA: carboxypeptidase regulatory-like domain-containing protein [Terriglobales bacterium]|nr:carboxypeptidase regulatory-like domain-containing protein [Terriglobales bacterium]
MPTFRLTREPLALALFSLCLVAFHPAWGQEVTATITGSVVDPTGASIVGAALIAKDTDRGTVYTVLTNSVGVFNLPRVPIGTYQLKVTAPGFQSAVYRPITLVLNQTARVDFQLNLGLATETIDVISAVPLLHTDTTQLSTVIDARTNVDLPLLSRNYVQLTLLAPGTVNPNPQTLNSGDGPATAGRPYVNGNREQANNFLLDGMDNNQVSDNLVGFTPSVDAIQEFSLITQNPSAEFGSFQGGIISASIKSGTNGYHGSVFEFFRNDALNANNWANNFQGLPRPALRWNMFGATFGGPIMKNKLFFFVDYQGQRFDHPASSNPFSLFTPAERQGDFSQLLTDQGVQLYNPFQFDANGNRTPFPNNQIPASMMDPVAANLFSSGLYPLPTSSGRVNNFINTTRSHNHVDQGDVRIDYKATQKDRLYGRISEAFQDNPEINSFTLLFDTFNQARLENGTVNWTHNFSPNVLSEAGVGANYVRVTNGGLDHGLGNLGEKLGIANANDHGPGLLEINPVGVVGSFGRRSIGTAELFADTVFQFKDAFVITHSRHVFHTGFQYWRQRVTTYLAGTNGRTGFMNFSGRFTAGPDQLAVAGGGTGAGEADFFLGLPDSFGRGVGSTGTWGQRGNVFGVYFQDDWRATDTLTLNLGLRYENHSPWVEVQNRQVNFAPISGQIQFAGQPCIYSNCSGLYNSYNGGLDFQPRIGLAWSPSFLNRKTVLRGAYGISSYLEGTGTNLRLPMNPPFTSPEFETDYRTGNLPATTTGQGLLPPTTDPFQNAVIRLWDPNIQPAISQQWNLAVEHQFSDSTTFQVAYVGQHGTHLMVAMPYLQSQLHPNGTITPSPFLSGNPTLQSELSQISGTASIGNMRYDALQATLQKRFSNGLQGQIAYTYSKCMTDSSGYFGSWGQAAPASAYWQNLYDQRAEWGPCYYDVTHVLASSAVYELPIGRKQRWGKNLHPVVNAVIADWQLGAIVQLRGGFPLTIFADDASGTNSRGSRANCIAPPHVFGRRAALDPSSGQFMGFQWFDPSSYGPPVPGTFGTCGVGTVRGPGLATGDLSIHKEFLLSEFKRLEFRAEFFNVTNTPILNSPNTFLTFNLGLVDRSQGERNIQFALKFYY